MMILGLQGITQREIGINFWIGGSAIAGRIRGGVDGLQEVLLRAYSTKRQAGPSRQPES